SFGMLEDARKLAAEAVRLAPDYAPARLRLGDVLTKSNRPAEARHVFDDLLAQVPGQPYALLGLARLDVAGEAWAAARTKLEQAIAAKPDFAGALSLLITVEDHLGNGPAADVLRARTVGMEFVDYLDPWMDELM